MKVQKNLGRCEDPAKNLIMVTVCVFAVVALAVAVRVTERSNRKEVYAASANENEIYTSWSGGPGMEILPTGISGVVSGVRETVSEKKLVERIGTSCEQVMVGQRVKSIENKVAKFDVSSSMEDNVTALDAKAAAMCKEASIMSDEDYDTLLHIVEAEAGTEDIKGRVLVANVIMNRVKNEEFPNTVTEVVWQTVNGVPQFSPTYDGRIHEVSISEETKEAVKQVLNGVDHSQGALFFIQKSQAERHNVTWFEQDLKKLFKHGVHEFYTYPDVAES